MKSPSPNVAYEATIRIMGGLVAGALGGYVTLWVIRTGGFLPPALAWTSFWAVLIGGFYKGLASAKRRIEQIAKGDA